MTAGERTQERPPCETAPCFVCKKPVWMCEIGECPADVDGKGRHGPHGAGVEEGVGWLCSEECWYVWADGFEPPKEDR